MKDINIDLDLAWPLLLNSEALHKAPVWDFINLQQNDPWRTLAAGILSARSRDAVTIGVCRELFALAPDACTTAALDTDTLHRLLKPMGMYRQKADHLREAAAQVCAQPNQAVPATMEGLQNLPGVGPKVAALVLSQVFGQPYVCVDVHVHRISNRWGLANTKTPEQTFARLMQILPEDKRAGYNRVLVALGQTLCLPQKPRCQECPLAAICPASTLP